MGEQAGWSSVEAGGPCSASLLVSYRAAGLMKSWKSGFLPPNMQFFKIPTNQTTPIYRPDLAWACQFAASLWSNKPTISFKFVTKNVIRSPSWCSG